VVVGRKRNNMTYNQKKFLASLHKGIKIHNKLTPANTFPSINKHSNKIVFYIRIKNIKSIFKSKIFKLLGHDYPEFYNKLATKVSRSERENIEELHQSLTRLYGDYEVIVSILPGKIKLTILTD